MRMRLWALATLTLTLVALGAAPGFAQPPAWVQQEKESTLLDQRTIHKDPTGNPVAFTRANHQYGYLEAEAIATADPRIAVSEAHAITLALKAARLLAYEKLLEETQGIRLRSDTLLREEMVKVSALRTRVEGAVRGAKILLESYDFTPQGSVIARVRLGLLIYGGGEKSLLAPVIQVKGAVGPTGPRFAAPMVARPAPPEAARPAPPEVAPPTPATPTPTPTERPAVAALPTPPGGKPYTGLIVDASGLEARPALVPRIKTQQGKQEVYGSEGVDKEIFLNSGLVGYASTVDKARAQRERVGDNPLVLRAVASDGTQRTDLLINEGDATRVLQADLQGKFLRKCQVMFVLN